jgi:hypothetical protein
MKRKKSISELVIQLRKNGINASLCKSRETIKKEKIYCNNYSQIKLTVQS